MKIAKRSKIEYVKSKIQFKKQENKNIDNIKEYKTI